MDIEQKAGRARALLSDDLLTEVIEEIRLREVNALCGGDPHDMDGLQKARLRLWAIEQVTTEIRSHLETFEIEQRKGRHRG